MEVLKYNKATGLKNIVRYPAIWGNEVQGLNSDIEYFEITEDDKPDLNVLQYSFTRGWRLSNEKGEYLNKAIHVWIAKEKSQEEVIDNINQLVGDHIESLYPLWEQCKHNDIKVKYIEKLMQGLEITEQESNYIEWARILSEWVYKCRIDRDRYESDYLSSGILPEVIFDQRPLKPDTL